MSDFFTLFGLPLRFSQNTAEIKENYLKLQQKIHPDNFVNATPVEKRLSLEYAAKINEAYRTLNQPIKRASYLLAMHGVDLEEETNTHMPADFLMEQMEMRERLSDPSQHQELKNTVEKALAECQKSLTEYLDQKELNLLAAKDCLRKMFFYQRIHEELIS